jgi:hypothetical protein
MRYFVGAPTIAAALGLGVACSAEPAAVLTANDDSDSHEGPPCGAAASDCGVSVPEASPPSDAGCVCTAGTVVGCLDARGPSASDCTSRAGKMTCGPDGLWGPCVAFASSADLPNITLAQLDELNALSSQCTIVHYNCTGVDLDLTSGDCKAFSTCARWSGAPSPLQ